MRITHLRQADLNLLIVFTVLAEERNVTRAAARLLLSQPAASRALQRLRDMFHDDLLIRTSSGYQPTPKGERLLHELSQPCRDWTACSAGRTSTRLRKRPPSRSPPPITLPMYFVRCYAVPCSRRQARSLFISCRCTTGRSKRWKRAESTWC